MPERYQCPMNNTTSMNTTNHAVPVPMELRKLRAAMQLKDLSMRDISAETRIPYTTVSGVLCGRLINPQYLQRIQDMIETAPVHDLVPT